MGSSLHTTAALVVDDLGALSYADGLALQRTRHAETLAWREHDDQRIGQLLLLEHTPPVITVSRRKGARDHLLASAAMLKNLGVEVEETDRGGDITYHGPGQLVAYPILDLNRLGLNLRSYMRWLEQIVIDTCNTFGVDAHRDACATGVWVGAPHRAQAEANTSCQNPLADGAKLCALGVRVSRWISMHGIALNVTTNLDHFGLIVPCGLAGRPVSSLSKLLGEQCPSMPDVKREFASQFARAVDIQIAAQSDRNPAKK